MTYAEERDQFVSQLTRALPEAPAHHVGELARALMRAATTLDRLAVAQCNGDWPADNGERKVVACPACESLWVRSVLKRCKTLETPEILAGVPKGYWPAFCPDCRTAERVKALCLPYGIVATFGGDPRGYVVKLTLPGGAMNTWGQDGYGVPTRGR